jgi:hypothetical protein
MVFNNNNIKSTNYSSNFKNKESNKKEVLKFKGIIERRAIEKVSSNGHTYYALRMNVKNA